MMMGHLRSKGIRIQCSRLRKCLHRVDSNGIAERRLRTIRRRKYFVPSPNFVWHLDGTHKLIRWKLVVHAAIDGFSRLITYCWCSSNNRSETVLQLFNGAVTKYGLPLKVRTDQGIENVRVWEHMYHIHQNSNAVIIGQSVHNQRVERLHRDINTQVLNHFYNEFFELEDDDHLNPDNNSDIFCLHQVYLPKINKCLSDFTAAFNNHSLSTEGNQTPVQLFRRNHRLLQLQQLNPSGSLNFNDIISHSRNIVQVPLVCNPLDGHAYDSFCQFLSQRQQLSPKSLYIAALQHLANVMC